MLGSYRILLVIGPDEESEQWAKVAAETMGH